VVLPLTDGAITILGRLPLHHREVGLMAVCGTLPTVTATIIGNGWWSVHHRVVPASQPGGTPLIGDNMWIVKGRQAAHDNQCIYRQYVMTAS